MDKLKNRLKYFGIGLGIGCILVYFMFGNRGCAWFPGNRVKNMIGEKEIFIGDSVLDVMTCEGLSNDDIYGLLKEEGDVEFSLSQTDTKPKLYVISGVKNEKDFSAKFALHEGEEAFAEVISVGYIGSNSCSSTRSNAHKSTLPLPHADVMAILNANEFRIIDSVRTKMDFYGLSEDEVLKFHETSLVDIERSRPRQNPNPTYLFKGKIGQKNYEILYIIGENRTRIANIIGETPFPILSTPNDSLKLAEPN
jgi:hypothetical protein